MVNTRVITASDITGLTNALARTLNVKDFQASGSDQTTTGNVAGYILTVSPAIDLENGQGVAIFGAGNPATVQTPTGITLTTVGTAGTTSLTYKIAPIDAFGGVGGASAGVTISTANATLSINNYVNINWTAPVTGPTPKAYVIYKNDVFIGIAANTTSFNDQGIVRSMPSWCPSTPPVTATTGMFISTIASGGGTSTLVLADYAPTSASGVLVQHDDTVALRNAFNQAMTSGRRLTIPDGTFLVSSSIEIIGSGSLDIVGSRNAILKSTSNLGDEIFGFTDQTSRNRYALSWKGGQFDNSAGMFGIGVASDSCVGTTRISPILFDGVVFNGASSLALASVSTDSGIAFIDATNVTITNCIFNGQGDQGVYGSGGGLTGGTDDGGDIIITDNHFINCGVGVGLKRQLPRTIVTNNTMDGCFVGIAQLEASVPAIDPGRQAIISNNIIRKSTAVAICVHEGASDTNDGSGTGMIRQSRTQILGNKILDFGYLSDGVTPYNGSAAFGNVIAGICVQGASQCRLSHNLIALEDWTQNGNGSVNHKAIYLTNFVLNSVTYNIDTIVVDNCDIINLYYGIFEDPNATSNGPTIATGCTYHNVHTATSFVNANSINESLDYVNGAIRGTVGSTEIWRFNSAGIFSTRFRTFLDTVGITKINRTTATLNFGTVAANSTSDLTVSIPGMTVSSGTAKVTPQATNLLPTGISYFAFVSANDVVTVRAINHTTAAVTIPSGSFVVNAFQIS